MTVVVCITKFHGKKERLSEQGKQKKREWNKWVSRPRANPGFCNAENSAENYMRGLSGCRFVAHTLPARTRVTCGEVHFQPPSFLSRLKVLYADYHTRDTSRKDLHRLRPTCIRGMHPLARFPRKKRPPPTVTLPLFAPPRLKIIRHGWPSIKSGPRYCVTRYNR